MRTGRQITRKIWSDMTSQIEILLLTKVTSPYNPVLRTKEQHYKFFRPKRINTQKQIKPKRFRKKNILKSTMLHLYAVCDYLQT